MQHVPANGSPHLKARPSYNAVWSSPAAPCGPLLSLFKILKPQTGWTCLRCILAIIYNTLWQARRAC